MEFHVDIHAACQITTKHHCKAILWRRIITLLYYIVFDLHFRGNFYISKYILLLKET